MTLAQLLRRMARAAALDWKLYEEVEADRSSLRQATLVVLLACAAGAAGTWVRDAALGGAAAEQLAVRLTLDLVEPMVFWLVGSALAYMVGATFFRGPQTQTDYREVLRTTGFAFTPGLLRSLAFVPPPVAGFGITVLGDLWMLVCGIVAVRQALDFTTLRAVGTFGVAYTILWLVLQGLVGLPV